MKTRPPPQHARSLLLSESFGILGTHSQAVPGYPFGSVAPYSVDRALNPIILISEIAQHTRNIRGDARVSLTVVERGSGNVQAGARLTLLGTAEKISGSDPACARYGRYFPDAREYSSAHDFSFYRLEPVRCYFIAGFGAIHWLDWREMARQNPFSAEVEAAIVEHMNRDHRDALRAYCRRSKGLDLESGIEVSMAGIDAEGFEVLAGGQKLRFEFEREISTPEEARAALVAMAREAMAREERRRDEGP